MMLLVSLCKFQKDSSQREQMFNCSMHEASSFLMNILYKLVAELGKYIHRGVLA